MTNSHPAVVIAALTLMAGQFASGQDKMTGSVPRVERLECAISNQNSDLAINEKNEISILIRNLQSTGITIKSLAVYLSPSSYLGPYDNSSAEAYAGLVDLETKGALELEQTGQYPSTLLTIASGGQASFKVSLSGLQWER